MRTYKHGFPITPGTANLNPTASALYVGGTGNVNCILWGDFDAVANTYSNTMFVAVPVGTTLEARFLRIWSTGTTATNLVGLN